MKACIFQSPQAGWLAVRLLSWRLSLTVALGQQQRASNWESMELPALEDYGHDSIHVFTYV